MFWVFKILYYAPTLYSSKLFTDLFQIWFRHSFRCLKNPIMPTPICVCGRGGGVPQHFEFEEYQVVILGKPPPSFTFKYGTPQFCESVKLIWSYLYKENMLRLVTVCYSMHSSHFLC